ncbi:MAG TPA: EAL domain-containing protein [Methyloceanibacter sp.]
MGAKARQGEIQCYRGKLGVDPAERPRRFSRQHHRAPRLLHTVDPDEFALFTGQLNRGKDDVMRLLWCPRVTRQDRAAFETARRENGSPDFAITTWSISGPPTVSPERHEYFPVLYSTVASQLTATIGVDMKSEPVRGEAIARARDGNTMATAQGIQLRNTISGQRDGFLAVLPVYRRGMPIGGVNERRENTLGVMIGAFQTSAVFDSILSKAILPKTVDVYLYEVKAAADALPVYMRGAVDRLEPIEAKSERELSQTADWSMEIKAGNASWNLVVVPAPLGLTSFYRAWLVLAGVLLVFGAVLAYMWASLRHARRLETANSRILELAQTDLLTNLANRRAFTKRLTMAFTAAWRGAPPFAVLILLKEVVNRLRNAVRPEDLVARFGGDEFAVLVTEVSDPETAEDLAARIGRHLSAPFSIKGHKIRITSSIGIALYSPDVAGAEAMMMQADLALYGAKDDGRNCYRFHSQALDLQVRERVLVADELRLALDEGELELYYQPQVELSNGRIIGLEALIRWNHKTRGLLTPGSFIAIAEQTGAILPLGRWIFDSACQQLKLWQAEGIAPAVLSVNVSGVQLKNAAELEREVEESLSHWNIDPGDIELELTESVLMEATQRHSNTLQNLRRLGTKIAIDDFGTGYSSLKYLTQYPVNRLKLAQEFVLHVTVDYRNAAVVRAAIRLANELGLEVIAEGVETEAQVRFLLGAAASKPKAIISAGR